MVLALWEKQSLRAVEKFEKARETWEMENFPDGEAQEMVVLYEAKGYTNEQGASSLFCGHYDGGGIGHLAVSRHCFGGHPFGRHLSGLSHWRVRTGLSGHLSLGLSVAGRFG